jgi:hypothetical protein
MKYPVAFATAAVCLLAIILCGAASAVAEPTLVTATTHVAGATTNSTASRRVEMFSTYTAIGLSVAGVVLLAVLLTTCVHGRSSSSNANASAAENVRDSDSDSDARSLKNVN